MIKLSFAKIERVLFSFCSILRKYTKEKEEREPESERKSSKMHIKLSLD